jgi:hypothetical protein
MAKIFTPQVYLEISYLVAQGSSAADIADKIGCKLTSLRVKCSQQGISLRRESKFPPESRPLGRLTVKISRHAAVRLQQQAGKQKLSGTKLAAALLEAIVRDNLYDAVIDQDSVNRWPPRPKSSTDLQGRGIAASEREFAHFHGSPAAEMKGVGNATAMKRLKRSYHP